jgi:hypothetical protein
MRTLLAAVLLLQTALPSFASCSWDRVIGYTLVAKKTVAASIQDDKREDEFSGCEFNRILVFDDNTGIRCTGYAYHYAYRPDAYLFVSTTRIMACIDGEWFEAASLR